MSLHQTYPSQRPLRNSTLLSRDQRAPAVFEDRIELASSKAQNLARKRQQPAQAIRHVFRRQLVEQAKDILWVAAQLAVGNGPETQRVKVSDSGVAAEEDGVCGIQVEHLDDESADVVRVGAAKPSWSAGRVDGDVLCVVELDVPIYVRVGGAIERANVEVDGLCGGAVGRKKLVEERSGAVEQDGLGSEEEVGIFGYGVLVAVELVLGEDALVVVVAVDDVGLGASGVSERGQLLKVGGVERVVVAEEKVAACERCVSFEFLDSMLVKG